MGTETPDWFLKIVSLTVALFLLGIIIAFGSFFYGKTQTPRFDKIEELPSEFCGYSTYGKCEADSDCVIGGCSGQVCQSKNEKIITTCEWKDCYNAKKYNLKCRCINGKCQWSK